MSVWVEIAVLIEIEPLLACHAPRERVSWNAELIHKIRKHFSHAPRERVSWNPVIPINEITNNVTLHVSVWVEIGKALSVFLQECHAPRERVSWNHFIVTGKPKSLVTLHVSVWVEISFRFYHKWRNKVTLHVSVWVEIIHADQRDLYTEVTLHVSVWVEISCVMPLFSLMSSRSTWACELK